MAGFVAQELALQLVRELGPIRATDRSARQRPRTTATPRGFKRRTEPCRRQSQRCTAGWRNAPGTPRGVAAGCQNNRRARFHTAAGSAKEVQAALMVADAWGFIQGGDVLALTDRVVAITYRLSRGPRR